MRGEDRMKGKTFGILWVVLALIFLGLSTLAGAQTNSATLGGTVVDANGAVVPQVVISLSSQATGLKRQTTTNNEGIFTFPVLPPGVYSLMAEREGFSAAKIENIELAVAAQVTQDITLQV